MSRLIEKLTHLRRSEPQPMGFALSKPAAARSKLPLIASVSVDILDAIFEKLKSADAVLVAIAKAGDSSNLEKVCQAKDIPAGGWIKTADSETIKKLTETSCDFVVFPASAPAAVVRKEKIGRILELDSGLNEGLLRTASDLPIDAVMLSPQESSISLTVSHLMQVQRVMYLVNKPVLVPVAASISADELQTLWDMGTSGVVVEIGDEKAARKLSDLHDVIQKLETPTPRKKAKFGATVPHLPAEAPPPPEHEEEEEDE
jgi:hypothetical protein